jgi:acylphosphatase
MAQCIRYLVSGRVQGVFFRASARKQALILGLTGWVHNLPDGRVEVLACGEQTKQDALHNWLKVGPPHAAVEDVQAFSTPSESLNNFTIV